MNKHPHDRNIIDVWFRLRDQMFIEDKTPTGARPPSIRDACYAWALAQRRDTETTPETIEAYVNGLELGAMGALREAWNNKNL
jgi:hypothetical protein